MDSRVHSGGAVLPLGRTVSVAGGGLESPLCRRRKIESQYGAVAGHALQTDPPPGFPQMLYVATDHRDKGAVKKAFAKHGVKTVVVTESARASTYYSRH